MSPLRLCFVGPAASVTLRRCVNWFAARGHEVTVITVEPVNPSSQAFHQIDVSMPLWPRKLGRVVAAARMALAVRQLKPDVLHIQYLRGLAWGLPLARFHPCVATPWGSDILEEQGAFREWYSRALTRGVLRWADLVTVHSAYMESRVRELFTKMPQITRIGRGIDLQTFRPDLDVAPLRRRWEIEEDRPVIFSPRLARPFYNHDRIIRALPTVREKFPKALLVVAEQFADAAYATALRRLAVDLGVADQVKFVGAIPHLEMPLWLNLSDAVVMVPRSDGMPNTLLEALACGTVPILNRLPQYAELIEHGVNGFLVDPDEGDLAGALIGVLSDPGLKRDIARRNRDLVVKISDQDQEMSRMESWYFKLAAASSNGGPAD